MGAAPGVAARRRAAGGFVVGVLILIVAGLAFVGWSSGIAVRATAIGAACVGVLTLMVAGFASSIGRKYPDAAASISGPNLLAGVIGGAVAVTSSILCLTDPAQLMLGLVLGVLLLVFGGQLFVCVRANHRDIRATGRQSSS